VVLRKGITRFAICLGLGNGFRPLGALTGKRFAWVLGHRKMDLLVPGIAFIDWHALLRQHLRAI
jgi:hypothetical protein